MNMMIRYNSQQQKHAFTIIELLLVLLIISMLIGLSLPGLSIARRQAWNIKCASNQHQIGIVVVNYASDHFDTMLREGQSPWVPQSGSHFVPWVDVARRYFATGDGGSTTGQQIFQDPAHPNPNHLVHYVMNGVSFAIGKRGGIDRSSADRRPAGPGAIINRPSQIIHLTAFTDDRDNSIARNDHVQNLRRSAGLYDIWTPQHLWGRDNKADPGAFRVRRVGINRHLGKWNNVLHFDSHVSKMNENEILDENNWFDGVPGGKVRNR